MRSPIFGSVFCIAGLAFSGPTFAVDYNDHVAICKEIDANAKHALSLDVEGRQKKCVCETSQLQMLVEPDKYRLMVDWMIDAEAFAKNNPDILGGGFMSDVISSGMQAKLACQ